MPHQVPAHPANPAPPAPLLPWPNGKSCALLLSVDVDAETAWTGRNPDLAEHLVTVSVGGYEARVGVPMMLELFRRLGLRATFFVTGWAADAHPAMCEAILRDGHEIGHHGYHHLLPDPSDPAAMEEELDRGFDALHRRLGVVPVGYRAPHGESFEELRASLARRGMLYSSSWQDDVRPYRQVLANGSPGVVELPVSMGFDDWQYGMSSRHSPQPLLPREHVLSIWKDELEVTRQWGGMITTVLHPQVSGRPMRLNLLREFLLHAMVRGDLWIATGDEIARHFVQHEQAGQAMEAVPEPAYLPEIMASPATLPATLPVQAAEAEQGPAWQDLPPLPEALVPDAHVMASVASGTETPPADEPPMDPPPVEEPPADEPPLHDPVPPEPEVQDPPVHEMLLTDVPVLDGLVMDVPVLDMSVLDAPATAPAIEAAPEPEPEPEPEPIAAVAAPVVEESPIVLPLPAQVSVHLTPPTIEQPVPLQSPFRKMAEPADAARPAAVVPPLGTLVRPRLDLPSAFPPLTAPKQEPPPPPERTLQPPPPPPPLSPRPPQRFGLFGRSKG